MDHPDYTEELKVGRGARAGQRVGHSCSRAAAGPQPADSSVWCWRRRHPACPEPALNPCPPSPTQVCHNVVKKAWAKTTRTYGAKQQRRPSYRLRQSAGGCSDAAEAVAAVAAEEKAQQRMMPPAVVAAQHHAQARPLA